MRELRLYETDFPDARSVHDYLAEHLGFPSYYGGTWRPYRTAWKTSRTRSASWWSASTTTIGTSVPGSEGSATC